MNRGLGLIGIATGLLLTATPAAAQGSETCMVIKRTAEGRFTYAMQPGFSVLRETAARGPFRFDHEGDVTSFACLRRSLIPVENDVEVLQAGFSLTVSDQPGRSVALELTDGRVTRELEGLDAREGRSVDAVIARMQARLGTATGN